MPIQFRCPECQEAVQFSDALAGLHVRCPRCSAQIEAPDTSQGLHVAGAAPPAPGDESVGEGSWQASAPRSEDNRPVRPTTVENWGLVRPGLTLEFTGILLLLSAAATTSILLWGGGGSFFVLGMGVLILVGTVVGLIAMFVARCLCCTAPTALGMKNLARASLVTFILFALAFVVLAVRMGAGGMDFGALAGLHGGGQAVNRIVVLVLLLTFLASHILFVIFLRKAAISAGNRPLGTRAVVFLVYSIVLPLLWFLIIVLVGADFEDRDVREWLGVFYISSLYLLVAGLPGWYSHVVAEVRDSIGGNGAARLAKASSAGAAAAPSRTLPGSYQDTWDQRAAPLDRRWRLVGIGLLLAQLGALLEILAYAAIAVGPMFLLDWQTMSPAALESMALILLLSVGGGGLLAGVLMLSRRWQLVGIGLLLAQLGIVLGLRADAAFTFDPRARSPATLVSMALILLLCVGGGGLLMLVGQGLCLVVPAPAGKGAVNSSILKRITAPGTKEGAAQPVSFLLMLLASLFVLAGGIGAIVSPQALDEREPGALVKTILVMVFAAHLLFVQFLRELANLVRCRLAADLAKHYQLLCVVAVVFTLLEVLKPSAVEPGVRMAVRIAGLVLGLLFLLLLNFVANAVRRYHRHIAARPTN